MRYWKFADGSVQSCSNDSHVVPGATEITAPEFDSIIAALPKVAPVPTRDPLKELDDLKAKLIEAGIKL